MRMSYIPSWFDDEHFLGLAVTFTSPFPSQWRLEKKIHDRVYRSPVTGTGDGDGKVTGVCEPQSQPKKEICNNKQVSTVTATGESEVKVSAECGEGKGAIPETTTGEGDKSGGVTAATTDGEANERGSTPIATTAEEDGEDGGATPPITAGEDEGKGQGQGQGQGQGGGTCEACAVYVCRQIDDQPKRANSSSSDKEVRAPKRAGGPMLPQKGIMKIRLQTPPPETITVPTPMRAIHATTTLTTLATNEITSLATLTSANCTSTPRLLAWKQEKQASDAGVPGGYIVYVLMAMVPGVRVGNFFRELGREGRDEFRERFREAWECKACGVINLDAGIRNLLWDARRKKCYIIDFELSRKATAEDTWSDSLYLAWDLAWLNDGDPNDISTWEL